MSHLPHRVGDPVPESRRSILQISLSRCGFVIQYWEWAIWVWWGHRLYWWRWVSRSGMGWGWDPQGDCQDRRCVAPCVECGACT